MPITGFALSMTTRATTSRYDRLGFALHKASFRHATMPSE